MHFINKNASDFDKADIKLKKLKRLEDTGEYDAEVARYIPGTLELAYQGILEGIETMEQVAHPCHKDLETFDFQLLLDKNLYTNLNSVHFVFPLQIRKATNEVSAIDSALIIVNNFFWDWIKEIRVIKYETNRSIRQEVFYEKGVLRNFTKFTGKHLCQSLFLIKL